jgi:hypothetical protein
MNEIESLWHGNCSLPIAFWFYGLVGFTSVIAFGIIAAFVCTFFLGQVTSFAIVLSIYGLTLFIYPAFASVVIWRSADHYKGSVIWRVGARFGAIALFAIAVWSLLHFKVAINISGA